MDSIRRARKPYRFLSRDSQVSNGCLVVVRIQFCVDAGTGERPIKRSAPPEDPVAAAMRSDVLPRRGRRSDTPSLSRVVIAHGGGREDGPVGAVFTARDREGLCCGSAPRVSCSCGVARGDAPTAKEGWPARTDRSAGARLRRTRVRGSCALRAPPCPRRIVPSRRPALPRDR